MRPPTRACALCLFLGALFAADDPAILVEQLFAAETGAHKLPSGTFLLHHEIRISSRSHDLDLDARSLILKLAPDFHGRAAVVISGAHNVRIAALAIDGNRDHIKQEPRDLPPSNLPFSHFTPNNGILAENTEGLKIEDLQAENIAGFAVVVSASRSVHITGARVSNSGSRNRRNRNNATGGILLEEGTRNFEVAHCTLRSILGNAVWTHSLYTSERSADGLIRDNTIDETARDAIQVGHATRVSVEANRGAHIGFPVDAVDTETDAAAVALDTAGNTDASRYRDNVFEEVNGKCMDLDGFHDGEVRGNSCLNQQSREQYPLGNFGIVMNNSNPDMQPRNVLIWGNRLEGFLYGGLVVIGSNNRVSQNHFVRLNLAHCNEENGRYPCLYAAGEPDLLRSGIYLRAKMHRAAVTRDNVIEDNEVSGYGIGSRCVVAGPGVDPAQNRIGTNDCTDDAPVLARAQAPSITRPIAFTIFRTGGSAH